MCKLAVVIILEFVTTLAMGFKSGGSTGTEIGPKICLKLLKKVYWVPQSKYFGCVNKSEYPKII